MSGTPFSLFDWRKPFLPALKDFIARRTDGCPGRALLVVPHNRPWRYLQHLYALDGKPVLLPKVMTFTELLGRWREQTGEPPVHTANSLDQVALLRECVNGLSRTDSGLAERFSRMEMEEFLPWGMRLAGVLDELFGYGVTAADIAHMEGEVAPPAAALLAALGRIQEAYASLLRQRGWTTPGFDACEAVRLGGEAPESLRARDGRPVLLAGFALLTPTEDTLLRRLWEAGADICLHTDPALALGGRPHWACEEHAGWLRRWQARATLAEAAEGTERPGPEFRFFAGYDVHSQLAALREDLLAELPPDAEAEDAARLEDTDGEDGGAIRWVAGRTPAGPSTAVVLTHNGLLLPVLHHLPRKDVNISMGYPLERSPLFRLLTPSRPDLKIPVRRLKDILPVPNRLQPEALSRVTDLRDRKIRIVNYNHSASLQMQFHTISPNTLSYESGIPCDMALLSMISARSVFSLPTYHLSAFSAKAGSTSINPSRAITVVPFSTNLLLFLLLFPESGNVSRIRRPDTRKMNS